MLSPGLVVTQIGRAAEPGRRSSGPGLGRERVGAFAGDVLLAPLLVLLAPQHLARGHLVVGLEVVEREEQGPEGAVHQPHTEAVRGRQLVPPGDRRRHERHHDGAADAVQRPGEEALVELLDHQFAELPALGGVRPVPLFELLREVPHLPVGLRERVQRTVQALHLGRDVAPEVVDDIVLLVARTRLLGTSHMAQWDVPADPAQVGVARTQALRRLQAWGLEELSFTTELILSELITNAVWYGAEPIRVRLLRDRSLICEVFDASSTSPHPRRAKPTDEGGRGLFLVASLANRWGTRYTPDGKSIWAELRLGDGGPQPPPGMWDDLAGL
ncbi:ATP-binding protein [Streptomyces sp. M2CJ-2]|nr:ATP-binding protein [Streptomyces sp. M2CJ-2]